MEELGTIKYIRRYPVKGMRGEDLTKATVTSAGLSGDRVYAFVDENAPNKRFPWLTARQAHEMLLFKPRFLREPHEIEIEVPFDKRRYRVDDSEFENLLETRYGYSLALKFNPSGCFDSKPVSLFSLPTVRQIQEEAGISLDFRRFRANFYPEWKSASAYFEDELLGRTLQLGGEARIEIVKKDSRCVIPTLDPDTSVSSPVVLQKIQQNHKGTAGVYGAVVQEGTVELNDPISLV